MEYIGRYAFSECEKLRHVTLGKNVACISRYAFKDCPIERIEMLSNIRYIDQNAFDDDQNTIFAVERGSYAAEWAEKKGYAFEFILTPEEIAYMEKCRREEEARKAEEERLRIEEEERKKREEKERRRKEEERIAARKQAYEQLLGEKKHWQEVFDANKSALFGRSAAARKEAKAKLEKIENKLKGYSDMVGKNGER